MNFSVPQSPIGYVEIDRRRHVVHMPTEWRRFFGLLQGTLGGSTTIISETISNEAEPPEQLLGTTLAMLASSYIDVSGQIAQANAAIADLRREVGGIWLGPREETGEILKAVGTIQSGAYTPTLTNEANLDASTAFECQWLRALNMVIVCGVADVDPTATATITKLRISLPVASNLAAITDLNGTAFCNNIAGMGAAMIGDVTNNEAIMWFLSSDTANRSMRFIFMYRIL